MFKKVFGATLVIFSTIFPSFSQNQLQEKWVDSVYQTLTPDQQIGQLFMVPAYSDGDEKHIQLLEHMIKENYIGGLIFMRGSPVKQINVTNHLQSLSKTPLLVGMNMAWGAGLRLDSTLSFPRQMALGALQDDSLVYAMGAEIAREMKILGVHINFAPVADINNNLKNPIVGTRSFGSNKKLVADKAIAYMKGLQENGALACTRHYPGHGDIRKDSHLALPEINISRTRLDTLELYPFKRLLNAGISGVMTGHIQVPAIDPRRNTPASMSSKAVKGILRDELKYDGLIVTDALNMKIITDNYKPGEAELKALQAGNDLLLSPGNLPMAINNIKSALKKKSLSKTQLEQSVKRILRAKYQSGLKRRWSSLNADNIVAKLNSPQAKKLQHHLYSNSITILNDQDSIIPVKTLDNRYFASLSIGPTGKFDAYLDKYAAFNHYSYKTAASKSLFSELRNYDMVTISVAGIDPTKDRYGLPAEFFSLVDKLKAEVKVVLCILGSPYVIPLFKKPSGIICTYENNQITQELAAEVIFGGIAAEARLPVDLSNFKFGSGISSPSLNRLSYSTPGDVGMDEDVLTKIDGIADEAITDRATPGCQVLIAKDGKVVFEKSYGYYTYDSIKPVTSETIYDIASLTKVMASMQTFMFLEERGLIDLDKKASMYLPDLKGTNKENMIWRDILTHQAGLWPYIPFWRETVNNNFPLNIYYQDHPDNDFTYQVSDNLYTTKVMQDSLWNWVKSSKLRKKAGRIPYDYEYSDLGYYFVKRAVEKILNQPMDEFLQQNFYDPMGLTSTGYRPLCKFSLSRIAPTENDNYFRHTLVYGLVHDEGAALCGGVSGHAGLFSNAIDLAKMLQMHIQDGEYGGARYFQPGTIEKFTQKQFTFNRRGIGWDKALQGDYYGPTSTLASPKTFGHTGFTGTAIWADPEFNLIYVFLSNRIYPDASNAKLIQNNIRTRIQDLIYESMWSYKQYIDSY